MRIFSFIFIFLLVPLFTEGIAHSGDCAHKLDGLQKKLELFKYRSQSLVSVLRDLEDNHREILELEYKLTGKKKGLFWGFDLRTSEEEKSDVKKSDLKDQIKVLKEQKVGLIEKLKIVTEENRRELILKIKNEDDPKSTKYFNEYLQILSLQSIPRRELVPVVVGSYERPPTENEAKAYKELVSSLVKRNLTVIYDADNMAAPIVASAAGGMGIGVSVKKPTPQTRKSNLVLYFSNPYSFFEALNSGSAPIVGPESLVGQALILNGGAKIILDIQNSFKDILYKWYKDVRKDNQFGISYRGLIVTSSLTQILSSTHKSAKDNKINDVFPVIDSPVFKKNLFVSSIEDLNFEELEHLLEYRDSMKAGEAQIRDLGGAAIFGSGQSSRSINNETYKVSYWMGQNGIPVFTGGAGGVMYAANMGAYDAGGISVGIPRVGTGQLSRETEFPIEVQTHTISTSDYHSRIPLLLNNREIILIEPGGAGTMRELATALLYTLSSTSAPYIVISDGLYYSRLRDFFNQMEVSPELRGHILFADNAEDVTEIIKRLIYEKKIKLPPTDKIKPRSNRREFPKLKIEKGDQ